MKRSYKRNTKLWSKSITDVLIKIIIISPQMWLDG
jgi:hypothetical protein